MTLGCYEFQIKSGKHLKPQIRKNFTVIPSKWEGKRHPYANTRGLGVRLVCNLWPNALKCTSPIQVFCYPRKYQQSDLIFNIERNHPCLNTTTFVVRLQIKVVCFCIEMNKKCRQSGAGLKPDGTWHARSTCSKQAPSQKAEFNPFRCCSLRHHGPFFVRDQVSSMKSRTSLKCWWARTASPKFYPTDRNNNNQVDKEINAEIVLRAEVIGINAFNLPAESGWLPRNGVVIVAPCETVRSQSAVLSF